MLLSDIPADDLTVLNSLCRGEIPDAVLGDYGKLLHAHHKMLPGSLMPHGYGALLTICLNHGMLELPKREPGPWDNVAVGTQVVVSRPFTGQHFCDGTFQGVLTEGMQAGNIRVACHGDMNTIQLFDANLVRLKPTEFKTFAAPLEDEPEEDEQVGLQFDKYEGPWSEAPKGLPVLIAMEDGTVKSGKFLNAPKWKPDDKRFGNLNIQVDGEHEGASYTAFHETMVTPASQPVEV